MRKFSVRVLAAALGFTLMTGAYAGGPVPHWEYTGPRGAEHWGDIDPSFATCKLGKNQSPINIITKHVKKAPLKPIQFGYTSSAADVVNNGHTIQVNLANGGHAVFEDSEYQLLQFHFHTPSEEKVNGKAYPLVAHLVHKNAEGKLAVVAVLFKQGAENKWLETVFNNLPAKAGETNALPGELNIAQLLPADRAYYAFTGSLTTPPCSEEVRWQVLKTPVTLSSAQLRAFQKLYPMNARPVQPLSGRVVKLSQ